MILDPWDLASQFLKGKGTTHSQPHTASCLSAVRETVIYLFLTKFLT